MAGCCVAYLALHIWLAKNSLVFDSRWSSARIIFERVLVMVAEIIDVMVRTSEI